MQDCRCQFGGEAVVMAGIFEAHAGMAAAVEKLRSGLRGYLSVGSRSAASRKARLWS
jgi:allophanate hydrolase subunit 2